MITKQKKVVYGVVLAGSVAMLVTQLLARATSTPIPPPLEVPADGGASYSPGAASSSSDSGTVTLTGDGSDGATPDAVDASSSAGTASAAPSGVDDALSKLERALGTLRNFQPDALRPALDQLVQPPTPSAPTSTQVERPSATTQVELPEIEPPQLDDLERRAGPPPLEQLRAQLEEQPLCGILYGAGDSAAMFGGRIVRVGDQLLPGDAVVLAIDPKSVLVSFNGNELRIEMPPFRPRPKTAVESPEGDEKSGEQKSDEKKSGASTPGASSSSEAVDSSSLKEVIDAIKQGF